MSYFQCTVDAQHYTVADKGGTMVEDNEEEGGSTAVLGAVGVAASAAEGVEASATGALCGPILILTISNVRSNRLRAPRVTTPFASRAASSSETISCQVKPSKQLVYLCRRNVLSHAGMSLSISGSKSSSRGVAALPVLMALVGPALFNPLLFNPLLFNPLLLRPLDFRPPLFNALVGKRALAGARQLLPG